MKNWEDKQALETEWRQFKYMAIAAHPENTETILEALEGAESTEERPVEEWATPITDEELENYVPYSEYADEIIAELRSQGFAIRDVPD